MRKRSGLASHLNPIQTSQLPPKRLHHRSPRRLGENHPNLGKIRRTHWIVRHLRSDHQEAIVNVDGPSDSIIVCREPVGLHREALQPETPEPALCHTREYLLGRELSERSAAEEASSSRVRKIHQELARAYAQLSLNLTAKGRDNGDD